MVRLNECSSYRGFDLSSDFCEKVLVKVQREFKNSSSYWKFELSGIQDLAGNKFRGSPNRCNFAGIKGTVLQIK